MIAALEVCPTLVGTSTSLVKFQSIGRPEQGYSGARAKGDTKSRNLNLPGELQGKLQ